jgi:hypothetical protein
MLDISTAGVFCTSHSSSIYADSEKKREIVSQSVPQAAGPVSTSTMYKEKGKVVPVLN